MTDPHSGTIEVLNHSVPHLPPSNNLNWLRQAGRVYGPDLVIRFMYGSMAVGGRAEQRQILEGHLLSAGATLRQRVTAPAKNSAIVFYDGRSRRGFAHEAYRVTGGSRGPGVS